VSRPESPTDEEVVCDDLLAYLRRHPNAMDSLRGIADWWLPPHRGRIDLERVERALSTLETRGVVERVGSEDRPLYRLRRKPARRGNGR
jgi:hypothetical protein